MNAPLKTIPSWSYSRIVDFEGCQYKAWLKYAARIPDPNPSPAADRGTAIHQLAEDFVRGKIKPLPKELLKFKDEFESLRHKFQFGLVTLEEEWAFTLEWEQGEWKTGWLRMKLDASVMLSPTHAAVIDYKTGKKFGNELKHAEQLQLYALAVAIRNPKIQKITAELWYLDIDDITSLTLSREEALRFIKGFDRRGRRMTEATEFRANPNGFTCKWCPYGPWGTGHCKKGVRL